MTSPAQSIREARAGEAAAIAALVNRAYAVEAFFVTGDRTSEEAVRERIRSGIVLVAVDDGIMVACVCLDLHTPVARFGMLSVEPARQRVGWGGRLIVEAEARARAAGADTMEIQVVDVQRALRRYYEHLGYAAVGTAPYVARPVTRPVHFVVMQKRLGPPPPLEPSRQ